MKKRDRTLESIDKIGQYMIQLRKFFDNHPDIEELFISEREDINLCWTCHLIFDKSIIYCTGCGEKFGG